LPTQTITSSLNPFKTIFFGTAVFCSVLTRLTMRPVCAHSLSIHGLTRRRHIRSFWQTIFKHVVRLLYNLKTIKWGGKKMTMPLALLSPPTRVTSVTPSSRHRRIYILYCDAYTISEYRYCVKSLSPAQSRNCNMLRAWN